MSRVDREAVLHVLRDRAPRAVHLIEIIGGMGLPKGRKEAVVHTLDQLIELGMVRKLPGRRFRLQQSGATETRRPRAEAPRSLPSGQRVEGYISSHPRGFAFVAAEDGGPDVFIPPPGMGAAMHGDRVEAMARPSSRGREGEVIGILARRPSELTGSLRRAGDTLLLEPDDVRLRSPMIVEGPLAEGVLETDAVVAELVRFPQRSDDQPGVRVVSALGAQGLTRVEVEKIKVREAIVEEFPDAVRREARAFGKTVKAEESASRVDLRGVDLVTIDPDDARDHDDALFAERTRKGGFRIVIAIADVSHYVRPGSAIDEEAATRATSIYLPDRAIPMLPPELSSVLASLVPKKDRLCLAVEVELNSRGEIKKYRFMEGVMRSGARLTYGGVARALGLTEAGVAQKEALSRLDALNALLDASRLLRTRRMHRGSLDFDLPEARVKLDDAGEPIDVVRSRSDLGVREAYRLVEEMMLLANEVVAADLTERVVPAIYRIHGKPDEAKIELFCQLAASLGHDLPVEEAQNPRELSRFLTKIDGTPEADTLRYLLLRSMQQAMYDTNPNVGHFGLAARDYLHFTSPIRRYPDLAVHRIVRSVIRGETIDAALQMPRMRRMAAQSSRLERRAMTVERDVQKLYGAILMRNRVGEDFEGTVSSVDAGGLYVALDAPFVDVHVPIERLANDEFELDSLGIRLSGRRTGQSYTLGDRIEVHLLDVNVQRRELMAAPVSVMRAVEAGGGRSRRERNAKTRDRDQAPKKKLKTSDKPARTSAKSAKPAQSEKPAKSAKPAKAAAPDEAPKRPKKKKKKPDEGQAPKRRSEGAEPTERPRSRPEGRPRRPTR